MTDLANPASFSMPELGKSPIIMTARRLMRHRSFRIGLALLLIVVLAAILAPG